MKYIIDLDGTLYDSNPLDDNPELVEEIELYPNALEFIMNNDCLLVTQGDFEWQNRKLKKMNISKHFDKIFIVEEKEEIFRTILGNQDPSKFTVLGDRIDSEIKIGNKLGMNTILLKKGKYSVLEPKDNLEIPNKTINGFDEI